MDKEFTIYTKMNKAVFRQFSFFNSFILDGKYKPIVIFPIAMFLVGGFFLVKENYGFASTMLCLGGLYIIGYFFIYQNGLRQQISKFKLENDVHVYTLKCDKNGVDIFNDKEKTRILWNEIHMLYVYKTNFYLYIAPQRAFIMPFKDITEGTASELFSFFKSVLPAEKIALKKAALN
ncbi:MAG: YcxB family protein [Eubacteriales bacterium]|nr:YcxB family protein [Eubacteriales bacterium]